MSFPPPPSPVVLGPWKCLGVELRSVDACSHSNWSAPILWYLVHGTLTTLRRNRCSCRPQQQNSCKNKHLFRGTAALLALLGFVRSCGVWCIALSTFGAQCKCMSQQKIGAVRFQCRGSHSSGLHAYFVSLRSCFFPFAIKYVHSRRYLIF